MTKLSRRSFLTGAGAAAAVALAPATALAPTTGPGAFAVLDAAGATWMRSTRYYFADTYTVANRDHVMLRMRRSG